MGRSRDHEFATCDNEFVFVRCRACGLTYLRNRPAPHTLGIIYPSSYYRYAAFLGYEYIVRIDGDGQHPVEDLARLLAPIREGHPGRDQPDA